ncbi:MAG: hypothetical protein PF448_07665 [Bacteroidales bacterium]|nr:hypothetical protein [Bacteroidales bacterium]
MGEIKEAEIAGLKQTRGLIVKEMVNRVISNDSLQSERNELGLFFLQYPHAIFPHFYYL